MPKARKTVHPGFPKEFIFESREAVDEYLNGDRITCLICGNDFRSLEPHLSRSHDMSADDYREKYGLPFRRGLCCADFSERRSELAKQFFDENRDRQLAYLEQAKAVQAVNGNPQRKKPKFWKNERTHYERQHYEEFVKRVIAGRAVSDVSNDEDVPTAQHVYWYMKRDKDFADRYKGLIPLFAPVGSRVKDRPILIKPQEGWEVEPTKTRV
ncbi:hypothetical protein HJB79_31685 [Rhizobium lentis]|uniref:MucR family transcriptional regulator n=1 Tax=Rhizobium lentis TaxID=1138194 RepID=UPI001C839376|nr:MucR family transcriptional regulator [Rhizobium lentis]MBX5143271.1 hypothetical protein [Rhizobium lentis]